MPERLVRLTWPEKLKPVERFAQQQELICQEGLIRSVVSAFQQTAEL